MVKISKGKFMECTDSSIQQCCVVHILEHKFKVRKLIDNYMNVNKTVFLILCLSDMFQ